MTRSIYSAGWIYEQGLNGSSAVIEVPENHLYVVKQLTFYSNTLAVMRGNFIDDLSGATLFSCASPGSGTPAWFGFYGHLVFAAGSRFHWTVGGDPLEGADVYAGGYDLINVS